MLKWPRYWPWLLSGSAAGTFHRQLSTSWSMPASIAVPDGSSTDRRLKFSISSRPLEVGGVWFHTRLGRSLRQFSF